MVKALFDTNILIDFLNAVPHAREELALYKDKAISVISWMEVLVGADAKVETGPATSFTPSTWCRLEARSRSVPSCSGGSTG